MIAPPRFSEQLLRALSPSSAFRDDVLGDLAEEFRNRTEFEGGRAAAAWYRREALRTAPHLVLQSVRDFRLRDIPSFVGRLFAAFAVGMALNVLMSVLILTAAQSETVWMFLRPIDLRWVTGSVTALTMGFWASEYSRRTSALVSSISVGILSTTVSVSTFIAVGRWSDWLFASAAMMIVGSTLGGILHAGILSRKAVRATRL